MYNSETSFIHTWRKSILKTVEYDFVYYADDVRRRVVCKNVNLNQTCTIMRFSDVVRKKLSRSLHTPLYNFRRNIYKQFVDKQSIFRLLRPFK